MTAAKRELLWVFGLLLALLAAFALFQKTRPARPKSGLTQIALQEVKTSRQVQKAVHAQHNAQRQRRTREVVTTRRYDPATGRLLSETTRQREETTQQTQAATRSVALAEATQAHTVNHREPAPTGLTAGLLATPTGVGLTAGVTLLALPPLSLEAQAGVLAVPQPAPVLGLAIHGTVAPRLVAGVGVYLGPQTALGYTPVPGLPVSVQPGLSLQYRF
jgi:hypothetical protein